MTESLVPFAWTVRDLTGKTPRRIFSLERVANFCRQLTVEVAARRFRADYPYDPADPATDFEWADPLVREIFIAEAIRDLQQNPRLHEDPSLSADASREGPDRDR